MGGDVPPNAFDSFTWEGSFIIEVRKVLICSLLIEGDSAVLQYKNLFEFICALYVQQLPEHINNVFFFLFGSMFIYHSALV